jgi:hypothetical protein
LIDLIEFLLEIAIESRYLLEPRVRGEGIRQGSDEEKKISRYIQEAHTERGIIRCLARDTPCECMIPYKRQAKQMEKVRKCNGCKKNFPEQKLLACSRCNFTMYCGRECQSSDWNDHKSYCNWRVKLECPQAEP